MANELRIVITADDHTDRTFRGVKNKVRELNTHLRSKMTGVGSSSGAAFMAGFLKAVTFGQVGRGFAYAAIKMQPQLAKAGALMGAALAAALIAEISTALTASLPLVLGAAFLALPIVGIVKKMVDAGKEVEKIDTKILSSKEKLKNAVKRVEEAEYRVREANKNSGAAAERNLETAKKRLEELKKEGASSEKIKAATERVEEAEKRVKEAKERSGKASGHNLKLAKENLEEAKKEHAQLEKNRKELEKKAKPLKDLKKHWTDFMDEISKPVRPFVLKSMEIIGSRLDEWAPKVKKAMDILAPALLPFTSGVLTGIENFFKAIGKEMPSIKAGMEAWGDNFGKIGTAFGEMIAEIMKDPEATIQAVIDFTDTLSDLAKAAGDVLSYVGDLAAKWQDWNRKFTTLRDEHNEILSGFNVPTLYEEERDGSLFTDIINDFKFYHKSLTDLNTKIDEAIKKLRDNIVATVTDLTTKIDEEIAQWRDKWVGKVNNLSDKVDAKIAGLRDKIIDKVNNLTTRTDARIAAWRDKWVDRVNNLSDRVDKKIADLRDKLVDKVNNFTRRIDEKIAAWRDRFVEKVRNLSDRADARVAKLRDDLVAKIGSMKDKALAKVEKMKDDFVAKLDKLKDSVKTKGRSIIQGFLDGMTEKFERVKSWVSGIATWIKDHKGPVSLDRQLLVPAGKALMGGLLEGLKFGFGSVGDFVWKAGSKVSDIISQIKESMAGPAAWAGGKISGGIGGFLKKIKALFGIGGGTYPGHGAHGSQNAWDFMIRSKAQGNAIAAMGRAAASLVIWNNRIWSRARASEGWRPYTRYGGGGTASQRHTNHVHVEWYGKGTNYARRGWAVVGENGPELLRMRGGERVIPAGDYVRAGRSGSTGPTVNQHFHFGNYVGTHDDLIRSLVDAKRQGRLDLVLR